MSSPVEVLTHGSIPSGGILQSVKITRRDEGFDDGYLTYNTTNETDYVKGDAAPGYAAMTIREVGSTLLPGGDYELTLRVQGLASGTNRRISRGFTENLEGFDNGTETWLARYNDQPHQLGSRDATYPYMVCISAEREEMPFGNPAWAKWNLRYMGTMGAKGYKRRISVDENITSKDNVAVSLPGGWTDPRKAQVSFPRIVVEDAEVVTSRPNTAQLPGRLIPPDAPPVSVITQSGTADQFTWHWPNQWKLAAIGFDAIVGTEIGIATYRYEYVYPATL